MNALVPRNTIEQIVSFRDRAVALYEDAFAKIEEADAALKQAKAMWDAAAPKRSGYSHHSGSPDEVHEFAGAVSLPKKDRYLRTARRLIDISVWEYLIEMTELETLMDKEAKDKLRDQMRYVPERVSRDTGEVINQDEMDRGLPPVTVENIVATLETFSANADLIFRRGVANVFSKLDRRFRSHDGFKVGHRIILDRAFNENGHWSYHSRPRDAIIDIERALQILDGKSPKASYGGIIQIVENERRGVWNPKASEHEGTYFKIRIYKNGNAHLWFSRDDLVEKVNKLLADYYGEVIPDGMTKEADPLANTKLTPAKDFGFFPTPSEAALTLLSHVNVRQHKDKPRLRILEPSAGTGNLARLLFSSPDTVGRYKEDYRYDNEVDVVEIQPHLARQLEGEGIYARVMCADFLLLRPRDRLYDVIVMNPPFDRERDIDHVVHAMKFLKPGGRLAAIMSAGTEFRETKKAIAFRALMEQMKARWTDLPPGSFAESGTYVNTLIVSFTKQ